MKAQMLVEIFQLSNASNSKVESISYKQKNLDFVVRNKSEKKITEFIESLTALKKYRINTDKIEKDDQLKLYVSKVTIGLSNE